MLTGLTPEKVTIRSQPKGFVDRDIFEEWFEQTVLDELQQRRELYEYSGPALLLLDNSTAHTGPRFR
jgi:hypothetical protein